MSEYLHGAYGEVNAAGTRVTDEGGGAIVYIGTAPVHTLPGGAGNVNRPIAVRDLSEAKALFGYSNDWASYTLCEAMYAHLQLKGVGPIVLINVLDPATHTASSGGTVSKTPENGRFTITDAESIVLDSIVIQTQDSTPATKVKGTDYMLSYDADRKIITVIELTAGALGSAALTVTYDLIDVSKVTGGAVIGSTDDLGTNTGLYAVRNVYPMTGYIPAYLAAPGFSSIKAVHDEMYTVSRKINDHWDAYLFADLPLLNGNTPLTMETAATYKEANGYNHENEEVFFPLAVGTDGKKYHLSVLAAANFQELLIENDGVPFKTHSNTVCDIIENLYMGEANIGKVWDDPIINKHLNRNGICSAAFMGGQWVLWGCHSADYNQSNKDSVNVADVNRMMLYYISNDFQYRRRVDVDKPMTINDIQRIVAEEQMRLDGLKSIGALIYGEVRMDASREAQSDVVAGNFRFIFDVQATPLAHSLKAIVNWTEAGFATYFAEMAA